MNIVYKQDKLPFTCNPIGAALTGTIHTIVLWKNSTSGWKEIVKTFLDIKAGAVVDAITWNDTNMRARVPTTNIKNMKVYPSDQAGLQIEISLDKVQCSDSGKYRCSITGEATSDINSESAPKTVTVEGKQKF